MAHDVFISYAEKDMLTAKAVAESLKNGGIRSWVAFKELKPGDLWAGKIPDAIEQSQVFILIFSAAANASAHTVREVQLAFDMRETLLASGGQDILFIPFFIEDVKPTGGMRYFMVSLQRFMAAPPKQEHYVALTDMVRQWLDRQKPSPSKNGRSVAGAKKAAKKKPAGSTAGKTRRVLRNRDAMLANMKQALVTIDPPGSPPPSLAKATPEALLSHITAVAKERDGSKKRRAHGVAAAYFISFLGLRHGATVDDVLALHGPCAEKLSSDKKHVVLNYSSKGLDVFCDKDTRKVSLIAVKALNSAPWERWSKTQPALKYLGKTRNYITGKFGQPKSKIEMSRLNPEILDYDFTGFRGRSGYVAFHCPSRNDDRCVSMQVHWFH